MDTKWFWEKCGWKTWASPYGFLYYSPERVKAHPRSYRKYPSECLPPIDPNSLFKYAVPRLRSRFTVSLKTIARSSVIYFAAVEDRINPHSSHFASDEDPAQALYNAIYKALGGSNETD